MIARLTTALEVGGKKVPINADFRNVLTIFEAFNDPELSDVEKAYICLRRLYLEDISPSLYKEAIEKAYWFLGGGDSPKTSTNGAKLIDWKHDATLIAPAVSKALGVVDVRGEEFLHWETFLGAFGEIGEGLFSQIVHMRQKLEKGEKLDKSEKEFLRRNSDLVLLRSAEEQAAIDETEALLKELI